jgi:hypothetical protein
VTQGASWCTLCYADLHQGRDSSSPQSALPASAPSANSWDVAATADLDLLPEHFAAPQAPAAAVALIDPLTAPLRDVSAPERVMAPSPADNVPVDAPTAPTATPTWPCMGCGARNSMDVDNCTQCARPFLPAEDAFGLSLPGVGKLDKLDKPQRAMVAVGGIAVVTLLLVALAFLVGLVL